MSQIIPTEDIEAQSLAEWLRLNNYKFTHVGNESGQAGTLNIIKMMQKKKKMGVSPGFPDYIIILKRGSLLFIELKRRKVQLKSGEKGASPSKVSQEQIQRVTSLSILDNIDAVVAYGWEDAMKQILYYENL